jgi:hypothetical protein
MARIVLMNSQIHRFSGFQSIRAIGVIRGFLQGASKSKGCFLVFLSNMAL